jgi:GTP cyclohydrolase II
MKIMKTVTDLISTSNHIKHSNIVDIFTKYGMYQAKIYEHNNQEYLVIMSKNFFEIEAPILYIHSDKHDCDALDEFCACHYPISVALNMIHNEGGLILYSSQDITAIDSLLSDINAKKLKIDNEVNIGSNLKSLFKGYRGEYLTIDFILKDLKLSQIQLLTDNSNIIFVIQKRAIDIVKHKNSLSFEYGYEE